MVKSIIASLKELPHYQRYDCMTPHVGPLYVSENHKRLLIVAESHYLPDYSTLHLDADKWYDGNILNLNAEEIAWVHTSDVVQWSNSKLMRELESVMADTGIPKEKWHEHIAFMNYFLRPAPTGISIKDSATALDYERSYHNFQSVLTILNPDIILFVSRYVVEEVDKHRIWEYTEKLGCTYAYTNHPSSAWWHRACRKGYFEGRTSREHFLHVLKKNSYMLK